MVRCAGSTLTPPGRLLVLHYHQVLAQADPLRPDVFTAAEFAVHLGALAEAFSVVPLGEGVEMLRSSKLPRRAVAISFDDGYADNFSVALPVLQRHGLTATFFVATGYLDGGCMFNDLVIEACRFAPRGRWQVELPGLDSLGIDSTASRVAALDQIIRAIKYLEPAVRESHALRLLAGVGQPPPELMMTSEQLRSLQLAGMEIGGHTHSHPILARLDSADALREICQGRSVLQDILGYPPALFAYPNGKPDEDYLPRDTELVSQAGYAAAFTTAWGCATQGSDMLQLPRISSWDRQSLKFCLRILRSYFSAG